MVPFIALSLLVLGTDALLFPLNNGKEPEPELLFACPPPRVPQFGSIKCDYDLFDMSCTVQCDSGFQFENGLHEAQVKCDLFEGTSTPDIQKCVRTGGTVVNPTPTPMTGTGVNPSTAGNCVRSLNDCFGKPAGDYAYCANCRMFATCAGSGFYVRPCPEITVFDASVDRCVDYSQTACLKN